MFDLVGWIAWGTVAMLATVGIGAFVWASTYNVRTPIHWWNEAVTVWSITVLVGVQAALFGTLAVLFFTKDWSKLHLLWVAAVCSFPILMMRVAVHWFARSLENERRFVEALTGRPLQYNFPEDNPGSKAS